MQILFKISILIFFISQIDGYWITIFGGFHESKSLQCQGKNCKYGFLNQFENDSAFVLNCTSPPSTAIQLSNYQMMSTQKDYSFTPQRPNSYKLIIFDVYFTSQWLNDIIQFDYGNIYTTFITYSTQTTLKHIQEFCQSMEYEVQTYYFYLPYTDNVNTYPKFSILNNQVQAYIRHILVAYQTCSQDCLLCTGPSASECTSWGTIQSRCPLRQSLESSQCVNKCPSKNNNIRSYNRICIQFANNVFQTTDLTRSNPQILVNWNIIYDSNHLDSQDKTLSPYFYGVFHHNEGTYIAFKTKFDNYPLTVSVDFILCNSTPSDSGLSFYIDGIYFGSMYFDGINYQFDNVELKYSGASGVIGNCMTSNYISLDMFFYTNLTDFMFQIQGNFTQSNAGWILRYVRFSTGYCPQYCLKCNAFYKCLICDTNFARVSDGTCSFGCSKYSAYNGTFCVYYHQVTKYSKYLVKQFEDFSISDTLNQTFIPLTFTADDFQKGSNIFWSYEADKIVFGGKYVWVNAHFYQIYNLQPHHSLTIIFLSYLAKIFRPQFQIFFYIIQMMVLQHQIEQISTYNPQLKIDVQCFGVNVIDSYCAIYNYYIVVHYCRPYCLQCTNDDDCQLWDSYDSNIIKLKQEDCLSNQFFDEFTFTCENCPNECVTCFNEYECFTCKPNYYLFKTVCLLNCLVNQYYDGNTCQNCHYSCKQCKSFDYCIHCESFNLRYLENGQCKCYDGYYDQLNNIKCQSCNILCTKCNGPTNLDCLSCIQLPFIIQNSQTCQCQNGYFFDYNQIQCKQCQSQCETCFGDTNQKCLTCFPNQNRILKGLECECQEGYYDSDDISDICIQCPNTIDITLLQCYKNCGNGSQIWFDQSCPTFSCLALYTNLDNKCVPLCGDGNIVGDEQCDDGNNTQYDGCYKCKFQCQSHCTTCDNLTTFPCLDVCGDGYVTGKEECDDANSLPNDGCYQCKLECQPQCTKCIKGICYDCQNFGWVLDPASRLCIGACGDTFVVGLEQCDDGYNFNWNDNCYQCKRRCRDDCKTCSEDGLSCIECVQFGYAPYSYYCNPICGDGFVAINTQFNNSEQCDDNNLVGYDGCGRNCRFQCQVSTICTICNNNKCQQCDSKYYLNVNQNKCLEICNDGIKIGAEQCEDMNSLLYDGCYNCKINCQQSCLNCTIQGCQQCQKGYYLLHNKCQNICGDKIIVQEEDCDDGNLYPFDGCHKCRYQCQPFCLNCFQGQCLQCQDNYYLEFDQCSDLLNFSQPQPKDSIEIFIEFCEYQLINICYECKHGFKLNIITNQCEIIQKMKISKNIQYPYYQNYQTFIEYCQFSFMGICINCFEHYDFDYQTQQCVSICGDGLINGKEQCEDGNQIQFDGCYNCKYQCSEYCAYCWKSECQSCEIGRILVLESKKCELEKTCEEYGTYYDEIFNICLSKCGDGIIAQFEQCDDGNDIPYDGCFQCMYSCADDCSQCIQGVCIKECELGQYYSIDEQICQSFCGDGITIKPYEECDDGNEESNDGCFHCKLQCIINCEICDQQNTCTKCENGYQLIENECHLQQECQIENCAVCINQQCDQCNEGYILNYEDCQSLCGDGIVNEQELCDDGNDIDGDGCDSDCKPSSNGLCKNSECIILNYPIMKLKFQYELNGIQYVILTFDQPMKLNEQNNQKDLEDSLQFSIKNQNATAATFKLNFVNNATFEIQIIQIKVEVQFLILIEKPELFLIFDNPNILLNSDNLPIEQNEIEIELLTPNILNQDQQKTASSIIFVSEYILKVILIIVIFAFITGQFDIISNMFDVIQQLYYIKYINVRIGFNLFQFFELFKFIQLDSVYTKIYPQDNLISILEFYPSEKIFEYDGRNANYLVNLINQASVYLLLFLTFYSMKIICIVLYQKIQIEKFHKYTSTQLKVVLIMQQKIIQILKSKLYPQLLGVFFSMVYEYTISTFLAIKYSKDTVEGKIGFTIGIVTLFFVIVKLLSNLKSYPSVNKAQKESFKAQNYYCYLCVQKILYMVILIFFYNSCVIQILLNLLNEFQITLFTFIFQLMPTALENRKQIISHSAQFLIYASYLGNVFYENDPDTLIIIGWIIITLMGLLISSTLILDILYLIQPLIKLIFTKKSQDENLTNQEIFYIVENPIQTL